MNLSTLKIRTRKDPCLRKKSILVEEMGPSERMVMDAMVETMHQVSGVGLAAPQVGINQRFFVLDVGDGPRVIINPEVIKKTGLCAFEEGCLSVPEVTIMVKRAEKITIHYKDENNQKMKLACEGLLARAIQHEIDHLDGILIFDYASDEEKVKFKEQLEILGVEQKE